ncbi:MAG: XTP/dITP diphosphatase [Firmicutes bacterium]|nr:XTP/dITP diphosphatase [Bacillota bacterium]
MKLVIATRNNGKLAEYKALLGDLPFEILSLAHYPEIGEIPETGADFIANAAQKAETVAQITGQWTLADDSGLEVDALGGRPGVYSARFAGEDADDAKNNQKLLKLLQDVPAEERTARFRAVIALAHPGRQTQFAEGVCEGVITFASQGDAGFGYDPLFFYPPAGKTFAQMTEAEKNKISHRAEALAKMRKILEQIVWA